MSNPPKEDPTIQKMQSFDFTSNTPKVLFGPGKLAELSTELEDRRLSKPLIISSPSRKSLAEDIRARLEASGIGDIELLNTAIVHNPSHVIDDALASTNGRDALCSVGGGSAVGLGKALALQTGLPLMCVPTTYSGSEMTPIIGVVKDGKKTSTTDPRILPTVVIYDVDLTMDLPLSVSCPSGMNAFAHSVEALYAEKRNPVSSMQALESIKALSTWLPVLVKDPKSLEARSQVLYGAFLAGMVVASTGIALHHKLAHAVGGTLNLPHAETHSIILPHSLAYNIVAMPGDMMGRLGELFGQGVKGTAEGVVQGLNRLIRQLELPSGLQALGMKEVDIDRVTDVALDTPYWNPRRVDRTAIREIIRRAWAGEEARADQ